MNDIAKTNELIENVTSENFYPVAISEKNAITERYTKFPLTKLSALGMTFEPLVAALQSTISGEGGSGFYWVNTKGSRMFKFNNGDGFLGSLQTADGTVGGGQAILNPMAFNPTMLFVAAAIMSIDKKLDKIIEGQKEIIEFLEQKEKAKLRGNLSFLTDTLNNYKFNCTNEKYKASGHIKALDIKQESEQSLFFYREAIKEKLTGKKLLHSDKDVKERLSKMQGAFREYQLSLYLYSFSSFVEALLLENYDSDYLDSVSNRIDGYSFEYRELYTNAYDKIESESKSSVQSHLIRGLAGINKTIGSAVEKVPVISKSQIDETLLDMGSRLEKYNENRTQVTAGQLAEYQVSTVMPFIENIKMLNCIYNKPKALCYDAEYLYLVSETAVS
jgi:hypothetical protein